MAYSEGDPPTGRGATVGSRKVPAAGAVAYRTKIGELRVLERVMVVLAASRAAPAGARPTQPASNKTK